MKYVVTIQYAVEVDAASIVEAVVEATNIDPDDYLLGSLTVVDAQES